MKFNDLKDNNRGFSLVELLVSLLICTMVILAASMMLSVSARSYTATNSEVNLQIESQSALNIIENLLIESTSCQFVFDYEYKATDGTEGECDLIKIGTKDESYTTLYLFILNKDTHQLLVKKLSKGISETNGYANIIGAHPDDDLIKKTVGDAITSKKPALVANYVEEITVSPSRITVDTNDLIHVDIKLKFNGKEYTASSNISMRNGTHR